MQRNPRTILLVDDNAHARATMQAVLEALGASVVTASGGREAIALAEARGFDAAFIDIEMPEMDGAMAADTLQLMVPHLVAVTGRDAATISGPFEAILTKPLDVAVLASLLKRLFG